MSEWRKAWCDWARGLNATGVWLQYGIADIRKQYKRTFLGPVWAGVSTLIFVLTFSVVGGELFGNDTGPYIVYLSVGYVLFNFMVGTIIEFCGAFNASEHLLRSGPLPRSVPLLRTFVKNLLALAHTLPVIVLVLLWAGKGSVLILQALLGLLAILAFTFACGIIAAFLHLRFRDTQMALSNLFMITFFVTPVFWRRDSLPPAKHFIVDYNPIAQLLDLVRAPLNAGVPADAWAWQISLTAIGVASMIAMLIFTYARRRLTYWL